MRNDRYTQENLAIGLILGAAPGSLFGDLTLGRVLGVATGIALEKH